MRELEPPFEVEMDGNLVRISEHDLAGKRVFHGQFNDSSNPLVITVGLGIHNQKFWTSVPQGRKGEAETLGKTIAGYIRAKKNKICVITADKR